MFLNSNILLTGQPTKPTDQPTTPTDQHTTILSSMYETLSKDLYHLFRNGLSSAGRFLFLLSEIFFCQGSGSEKYGTTETSMSSLELRFQVRNLVQYDRKISN